MPIALSVLLIAAQAFIFTYLGTTIGNRISKNLTDKAELISGIVLAFVALSLMVEKLLNINF